MARTPPDRYDKLSMVFHWLTAMAVLAAFILGPGGFGRLLRQGVDPGTHADIVWHESLGILIFALTALRLLWTAVRPAVTLVAMPDTMRLASKLVHLALWGLLFITPITALLTLGSEGAPLTLLGGVRVEQLGFIAHSGLSSLADWGDVHSLLGDAIIWLAGLHALAAIFHHVKLKDGVLVSMLPWIKPR